MPQGNGNKNKQKIRNQKYSNLKGKAFTYVIVQDKKQTFIRITKNAK